MPLDCELFAGKTSGCESATLFDSLYPGVVSGRQTDKTRVPQNPVENFEIKRNVNTRLERWKFGTH
jgi:hypothetical protein